MSDVDEMLAHVAREWDKAEKLIKEAERARAQVVMASVNELRYAGRRLVDALHLQEKAKVDPTAKSDFDRYISEVLAFSHRAQHDAVDAIVLFLQKAIEKYENEFGISLLIEKYPRILDIKASISQADSLIIASRKDRMSRIEEYDKLAADHCPALLEHYQHLMANKDVLTELVNAKKLSEIKQKREFRQLIWVTILAGFGGGIIGALLTILYELTKKTGQ